MSLWVDLLGVTIGGLFVIVTGFSITRCERRLTRIEQHLRIKGGL